MTVMRLTVPDTVEPGKVADEVVVALADRLRDDHGYELDDSVSPVPPTSRLVYALRPRGSIVVDTDGALTVSLHQVDVDVRDLFIAVIGPLEQRYDGLCAEID